MAVPVSVFSAILAVKKQTLMGEKCVKLRMMLCVAVVFCLSIFLLGRECGQKNLAGARIWMRI